MALCSNRQPLPGSPSTCTLDIALVPIPTWILLASLPVLLLWWRPFHLSSVVRGKPQMAFWITYLLLLITDLAMSILELARLSVAKLGVGLLPFNTVGLIIALVIVAFRTKVPLLRIPLIHFWVLLIVFEAIKVNRLALLPPRTPSQYPGNDQFIDNVTMLALSAVFLLVEAQELTLFWKTRKGLHDTLALQSGLSDGSRTRILSSNGHASTVAG